MDKLRIGVFLDIEFKPQIGGAFSSSERLIEMINSFEFDSKIEVLFVSKLDIIIPGLQKRFLKIPIEKIKKESWKSKEKIIAKLFAIGMLKHFYIHKKIQDKVSIRENYAISIFLSKNKIDLLYYITPNLKPFNYPFITTHWDLGHKSMWVNQEVFSNTRFEPREFYHRVTLQKAFAIFAESLQSKKELIEFEGINEKRIQILPLFPGKVIEMTVGMPAQQSILQKWNIQSKNFYFYPAQFWPFKNQFGLVLAFKKVLKINPDFKLVLSGADHGNMSYIKSIVARESIEDKVIFTGFVTNEEIFTFYKNAIALVMPSLLGPTNMPLLEAYYLGCHVLCSNLEGHQEQMEDRAVYFDPLNHEDMAEKMMSVINNEAPKIIFNEIKTTEILNQNFLNLYNVRKTFDCSTLYLKS